MRVSNSWCDYNIVTLLPWSIYVKLTVFMPVLSSTTSPFCKSIFFVMYTVWCHVLRPYCKFFIWINVSMFVIHVLTQFQHVLLVLIVYYSVVMIYLTRNTSTLPVCLWWVFVIHWYWQNFAVEQKIILSTSTVCNYVW